MVGTMLDVGCGNGHYVTSAPGFAAGLDMTAGQYWSSSPAPFVLGSALRLPFRDGAFDTVVCFETIEHVLNPLEALRELRRIAQMRVILTVPNCELTSGLKRSNLIYHHWIDPTHVNFFDESSLSGMLAEAGFRQPRIEPINQIDLSPFVQEALRLPRWPNGMMRRLIRRWARPYHMTLLAIAQT